MFTAEARRPVILFEAPGARGRMIKRLLAEIGVDPVPVTTYAEAVTAVQARPGAAVVVSVTAPDMGCFQLLDHFMGLCGRPSLIVLAEGIAPNRLTWLTELGADAVLQRPPTPASLAAALDSARGQEAANTPPLAAGRPCGRPPTLSGPAGC